MRSLVLGICLAFASTFAPTVRADTPVRACPPGQAVQALDPGGKVSTCTAVVAPADLGAAISAEAMARMEADQQIRDSLTESGLSGRYAVVGTGLCTRSTPGGFGTSPEFVPLPGSTVQSQSFTYSGIREFNADGTIHGTSTVYSIAYPSVVLGVIAPPPSGGGGSVLQFDQNWTYVVGPDRSLTITGAGSQGTITQGGGVGNLVTVHGAPSLTGMISKDWRTIILTNASMQVEHSITTTPDGATTLADFPRVCTRTETLVKLAD